MEPFLIGELAHAIGAPAEAVADRRAVGISTDSRTLGPGEVFFALEGERFDGHAHLEEARSRGAAAAVVEKEARVEGLALLRVADTRKALLDAAAWQRRRHDFKVVAVTGSNGKTTTKELVAAALGARLRVVRSPKSFNNEIGLPLTFFAAERNTDVVVAEIGTSAPGEIARLAGVAAPDVSIVTQIAPAHLEGLGSVAGVVREKGALVEATAESGVVFLNGDDRRSLALAERARCPVRTFGVLKPCDLRALDVRFDLEGVRFSLADGPRVRLPLLGFHNVYNALVALGVARRFGIDANAAARALETAEPPPMRMQLRRFGPVTVLDDAYNANPGSMKAAICTVAALEVPGRRLFVLGQMHELGRHARVWHRRVGAELSRGRVDRVYAVGGEAKALLEGASRHGVPSRLLRWFADAPSCAHAVASEIRSGDLVLVKGSRAVGLERVVAAIERSARRLVQDFGGEADA